MGDWGVSVYRNVTNLGALGALASTFSEQTEKFLSHGAEDRRVDSGLSLLEINEVMKHSALIGRVPLRQVIDDIYESVSSLRKPIRAVVGKLCIVGFRNNPLHVIGLSFDDETRERLQAERADILAVLESFVPGEVEPIDWMRKDVPHVTIGRVTKAIPPGGLRNILTALEGVVPNYLNLGRAVINNPTRPAIR